MKKTLFLVSLFLLSTAFAQSQPKVKLRVDVWPREVRIGDVIKSEIIVEFPNNLAVAPLKLPDDLAPFEVLNLNTSPIDQINQDKRRQTHSVFLTLFSTGTHTLPSFTLGFLTNEGEKAETQTPPFEIKVESLLEKYGDEGNLRPLKGFFNFRSYLWLGILIGGLLLALFLFLLIRHFKARKNGTGEPEKPKRPPEEVIWDAIHELEDSDLIENGQIKEYYSRLSSAVRSYLEGRFNITALDRTTAELLSEFRKKNQSTEEIRLLKTFFENGDLVKFAKFAPTEQEVESDLDHVKQYVQMTTPQDTPQEKEESIPA